MNTEQERADFEAWLSSLDLHIGNHERQLMLLAYKAGRAALQSQDRADAFRYRWLRDPCSGAEHVIFYSRGDYGKGLMSGEMLDEAIDHARRAEVQDE